MAVTGSKTNYVTLSATGDVFPATAKVQGAVGGPGVAPTDYAGLNLAGIVIRKSTGVLGKIQVQTASFSATATSTALVYTDLIPRTDVGTSIAWLDFWHMPEGGGGMSPRQIKGTVLSNVSIVLVKR
jgi:hypothetical protein